MIPLILAGASLAAQAAKGIAKNRAAKRQRRLADSLSTQGTNMVSDANANLDPFKVSQSLYDNKSLADNLLNSNQAGDAMKANADIAAGNAASQIKRSATTSAQAATGALAAEQMRLQGYNEADLADANNKGRFAGLAMSANEAIAGAENTAYQYNEFMPFSLKYERGVNLQNQGLQGQISSDNMRTEAFGDMMNGFSDIAMSVAGAYGSGTPFDIKKARK